MLNVEPLEPRRMLAFGDLDPSFGDGGKVIVPPGGLVAAGSFPGLVDMEVLRDGRIALAGGKLVVRHPDGQVDGSFGVDGAVNPPEGVEFFQVAQAPDGKIVASARGVVTSDISLVRYDLDGTVDDTFGVDGVAPVVGSHPLFTDSWAFAPDGSIYVLGSPNEPDFPLDPVDPIPLPPPLLQLIKLDPAGAKDTSFGFEGLARIYFFDDMPVPKVTTRPNVRNEFRPLHVVVAPGGGVRVVGTAVWFEDHCFDDGTHHGCSAIDVEQYVAVLALTGSGVRDTSFSGDGFALAPLPAIKRPGPGLGESLFVAVAARDDGRMLTATTGSSVARTSFAEFTPGGDVIATVNDDGRRIGAAGQMVWMPDGRVAVLGGDETFVLERGAGGTWTAWPAVRPLDVVQRTGNTHAIGVSAGGKLLFSGTWTIEVGDPIRDDDNLRVELVQLDPGQIDEPRRDVFADGRDNGMVYDDRGTLHVVYADVAARRLLHASRDITGRWGASSVIDSVPDGGDFVDVQLAADGRPAVAYYDARLADLKYAHLDEQGRWVVETVDSRKATGQTPALRFARDGAPWIAYYARTAGDLRLAHRGAGGAWVIETVDAAGDTGFYPDLREDPLSERWAVAYASRNGDVRLAERTRSGAWKRRTAATTTGGARHVQLHFGGEQGETPEIAYFDAAPADLKFAWRDPSSGRWRRRAVAQRGVQGRELRVFGNEHQSSVALYYFWDRSRDAVRYVQMDHNLLGAVNGEPEFRLFDRDIAAGGGGKFLSVAVGGLVSGGPETVPTALCYVDGTTGDLVVTEQ
jgi:uncharacterized delta-60 repeat protein